MSAEQLITPEEGEIFSNGVGYTLRRPGGQRISLVPVGLETSPVLYLPPQAAPTSQELVRRARCVVARAKVGTRPSAVVVPAPPVEGKLTLLNLYDARPVEPCESCLLVIKFTLTCTDELPVHKSCQCRLRRPPRFKGKLEFSFANNWRGYFFWPRRGERFAEGLARPTEGAESHEYPDMRSPGEHGGRSELWDTDRWDSYDWEVMVHNPLRAAKVRNELGIMLRFLSFLPDLARRDETAIPQDIRCIADSVGLSLLPVNLAVFFGGDLQVLFDIGFPRKAWNDMTEDELGACELAASRRENEMVKGTWNMRPFRPELVSKIMVRRRSPPEPALPVYREQLM
jgi:hypothetical protein